MKQLIAIIIGIIISISGWLAFSQFNVKCKFFKLCYEESSSVIGDSNYDDEPIVDPRSGMIVDQYVTSYDYITRAEKTNKKMRERFFVDLIKFDDFKASEQYHPSIELFYWLGCEECMITHKKFMAVKEKLKRKKIQVIMTPLVNSIESELVARLIYALDQEGLLEQWIWHLYGLVNRPDFIADPIGFLNNKKILPNLDSNKLHAIMDSKEAADYILFARTRSKRYFINSAPAIITNKRFKTSPRISHGDDVAIFLSAYLSRFMSPQKSPEIETKTIARKLEKIFNIKYAVPLNQLED